VCVINVEKRGGGGGGGELVTTQINSPANLSLNCQK